MPDLLTHFAVAFALASPFIGIRRAVLAGLIALLPDLDALFHVHRSVTHSLVVLLALALPIAYLVHRLGVGRRTLALAIASLVSHPVLDAFQTYTPILYPFLGSIYVDVRSGFLIDGGLRPHFELNVYVAQPDFAPFTSMDGPLFTSETLLISLALMIVPLLYALTRTRTVVESSERVAILGPRPSEQDPAPASPEDVTIVIPTLNEREAIGPLLDELRQEGYENVLVVDGYSTDGTPDVARERGATVVFQHGAGKAGAIKTALEHVKTPYMLVMDGDYSYDPRDIKRLLAHAANYDEVIGARDRRSIGWLHRLGNWVINRTFNLLFGAGLSDVCSGMYLVRTEALREVALRSRGFNVEVEIAAHMCTYGRVTEVPISYRPRIGRRKLKSFRDGIAILASVLGLARAYNPAFLFSSLAATLAVPGAVLTLWELYSRYAYGTWSLGIAWLGLVLLVVGLQGFTAATISLMLKRMERRILQVVGRERGRA